MPSQRIPSQQQLVLLPRIQGNLSVNMKVPPYRAGVKDVISENNLAFDFEKAYGLPPRGLLATMTPTSSELFQSPTDTFLSGKVAYNGPYSSGTDSYSHVRPVTMVGKYSVPTPTRRVKSTVTLCTPTVGGNMFSLLKTQTIPTLDNPVYYQAGMTQPGNVRVTNTPTSADIGPGTDYPVGVDAGTLNRLLNGGPFTIGSNFLYVIDTPSALADGTINFTSASYSAFTGCPPSEQSVNISTPDGSFSLSVFGGSPWCYYFGGKYWPWLRVGFDFTWANFTSSCVAQYIFPKYWPQLVSVFGSQIPIFGDEVATYDTHWGCFGDHGTANIDQASGTFSVS